MGKKKTSRERIEEYRSRKKTAAEQLAERAKHKKLVARVQKRMELRNESTVVYRDGPLVSGSAFNGKRR